MLTKDFTNVSKALKKAKRNLGDIPIISWLEGQFNLMKGNIFNAKAIFFKLSSIEKQTALGAYSLSQININNGNILESLELLKTVINVHPQADIQIKNLIAIFIKTQKFDDALHYIKNIESKKRKQIEGIIYYEKWKITDNNSELKKAYDLLPNIPDIVISYCNKLINSNKIKKAKKILEKSFKLFPSIDVFNKYISLYDNNLELAEHLLNLVPNSWIPYYGIAKLLKNEATYNQSLHYLIKAYQLNSYDFIAKEIQNLLPLIKKDESNIPEIDLSKTISVKLKWICNECSKESNNWISICPKCLALASYEFKEITEELIPVDIIQHHSE